MARPTKYRPEMCDTVVALMAEGASKAEVCAELDISFETMNEWCKTNEVFSEAVKRGERLSEGWWQRHGRKQLENKDFNSTLWYMNMKNRFGWADKQENKTEHTGQVHFVLTSDDAGIL